MYTSLACLKGIGRVDVRDWESECEGSGVWCEV